MVGEYFRIPQISYRWVHVWRRNLLVWLKFIKSWFVAIVGEPFLYLFAVGIGIGQYIDRPVDGLPYFAFIVPGLLAATVMNAATFEGTFGSFTRMNQQHTFHSIVTTPVNMNEVAVGDIMYAATKALVDGVVFLLIAMPLLVWQYGVAPPWWGILLAIPVIAVEGVLFASMALLVTAFARGYDFFSYYLTLVISVMFLFAGVFFPVSSLPEGVRWLAWVMPLAHPTRVLRELLGGTLTWQSAASMGVLVGLTLVFFVVAVNAIRIRLMK